MSIQQTKWFDRKFDFNGEQNVFPSIVERLRGAPARLEEKLRRVPENGLTAKLESTWSIKENVGHLIDLEPLWMGRLEDILNKEPFLRVADLSNTKTHEANHNATSIEDLLEIFRSIRQSTVGRLELLSEKEIYLSALHPRLKTPMRTMDHFLFVAEHDDHHLVTITKIIQTLHQS